MPDILTPAQRHRCMSHIRSKATSRRRLQPPFTGTYCTKHKKRKKLAFEVIDFNIFLLYIWMVYINTNLLTPNTTNNICLRK